MHDITAGGRKRAIELFVVGFLVLFMELALIRWFAANIVFMQFFTNIVLLACFLGMSCGCLCARRQTNWLSTFPLIALSTVVAALAIRATYAYWTGLAIDVGGQQSPQVVFFGTEYRDTDVAQFVVPIEAIVTIFFVLIALSFVGLGQVLGRAFDAYPNRVAGYTLNIGGSIVGIVTFSVLSFLQIPAAIWFAVCAVAVAYLLHQCGSLSVVRLATLAVLVLAVTLPPVFLGAYAGRETYWSPYYTIEYDRAAREISVDNIGHQSMIPFQSRGSSYSLIHLLQRHSGGPPFEDQLIIGAGSGNDIAHALQSGVAHVDAVEIDPIIQNIGIEGHPDRPYQDPRVTRHIDDGRHFLRTTDRKYDLVVYALVDSLVLHSGYANIRLESYLFTEQAFRDIRRVLKPGGVFVTYNFFRQGWIVERVAAMAESAFGCPPIVLSLPERTELKASERAGYTMIVAGCDSQLASSFNRASEFWLNRVPVRNKDVNGFALRPETMSEEERRNWDRISPTRMIHDKGEPVLASDDWPFLYLQGRLIPNFNLRSMFLLGLLGLGMVYVFLPKGQGATGIDGRMFFLGAAFMLLETRAVVQLALLFGSTWVINSMVFFTVLVLILLGNLYVLGVRNIQLRRHYLGLFAILVAAVSIPVDAFLEGGIIWRYGAPGILALGPMFFAAVIFARLFRESPNPDVSFGSNIAGAMVGGLSESFSMLLGFRYLLLLALFFYALSAWAPLPSGKDSKLPA
jgi:SAM-dependent methyltransferase